MRFERLPVAPLVDGPPHVGRPTAHSAHRPVGVLMRRTEDGVRPDVVAVHGLALCGFQDPEIHLVDLVK